MRALREWLVSEEVDENETDHQYMVYSTLPGDDFFILHLKNEADELCIFLRDMDNIMERIIRGFATAYPYLDFTGGVEEADLVAIVDTLEYIFPEEDRVRLREKQIANQLSRRAMYALGAKGN